MSLVAYGASDDSEESDAENQEEQRQTPSSGAPGEKVPTLPQQDNIENLLKELPAPKSSTNDNFLTRSNEEEEEELEEEVKPKTSQLADAPKPPTKKKQPVKITIPALDQDSDEEPTSKKRKVTSAAASGKTGLTSLLPAPVHLTVKEANRVLIPHTLTKKRTPAVNSAPSSKKDIKASSDKPVSSKGDNSLFQGLSGYNSDSDGEEEEGSQSSNFFSLSDTKKEPEVVLPQPPPPSNNLQKMNLPAPVTKHVSNSVSKSEFLKNDSSVSDIKLQNDSLSNQNKYVVSKQGEALKINSTAQDEPLQFKSSYNNIGPSYYSQTRGSHFSSQQTTGQLNKDRSMEVDTEKYQYPQYEEHELQEDPKQRYMLDQDFLRLQGKKQRGREEINIVDVKADDFIGEVDLMKNISAETEYVSKKKEDGPTSQQKRKHQITYLAHQAKERELELKNQWSQNRMTKRQTQAKYGF